MDRSLIIAPVLLELHYPVESFGAISLAKIRMIILNRARHVRNILLINPCPQRRNDRIGLLMACNVLIHLALGKCSPFLAAVIAFEVALGI